MGGRLHLALAPSVAFALSWAPAGFCQTAPPPASWGAQPAQAAPAPAPGAPAPAPAPPSTAAFPAAPASPNVAATPAPTPAPAQAPAPNRVARVRFEADEPGALLESDTTPDGRSSGWYVLCEAPCSRQASGNGSFRVSGPGYHPSRVFRLPDDRSEVAINAEMEGSSIAAPMALTVVGSVIASVGGLILLGGLSEEQMGRNGDELIVTGGAIGGAGAVMATIGVIMLLVEAQNNESKAHVAQRVAGLSF